ncbi:MAG: hypothetical protein ACYSUQ_05910 [Planctomycetota bacterium]
MKTMVLLVCCCLVGMGGVGCVSARAPESISVQIGGGPPPEDVDSSRVPQTTTHEEAQAELHKAYQQIRYLEHRNDRLADKLEEAREEREEYKRKYKRLKDEYDD